MLRKCSPPAPGFPSAGQTDLRRTSSPPGPGPRRARASRVVTCRHDHAPHCNRHVSHIVNVATVRTVTWAAGHREAQSGSLPWGRSVRACLLLRRCQPAPGTDESKVSDKRGLAAAASCEARAGRPAPRGPSGVRGCRDLTHGPGPSRPRPLDANNAPCPFVLGDDGLRWSAKPWRATSACGTASSQLQGEPALDTGPRLPATFRGHIKGR